VLKQYLYSKRIAHQTKNNPMSSFGERLRQLRTDKKWSRSKLAEQAGVHHTQIGRYETKGAQPSAEVLSKLATALTVSADYLASGSMNDQASERLQDAELLQQFRKVEDLPADQKMIVKELLDAFLLKCEIRGRFAAA
jgi:transcriptional regulator with XRE-family HTH domain